MSVWSELLFLQGYIASPRLARVLTGQSTPDAQAADAPPARRPGPPHAAGHGRAGAADTGGGGGGGDARRR